MKMTAEFGDRAVGIVLTFSFVGFSCRQLSRGNRYRRNYRLGLHPQPVRSRHNLARLVHQPGVLYGKVPLAFRRQNQQRMVLGGAAQILLLLEVAKVLEPARIPPVLHSLA